MRASSCLKAHHHLQPQALQAQRKQSQKPQNVTGLGSVGQGPWGKCFFSAFKTGKKEAPRVCNCPRSLRTTQQGGSLLHSLLHRARSSTEPSHHAVVETGWLISATSYPLQPESTYSGGSSSKPSHFTLTFNKAYIFLHIPTGEDIQDIYFLYSSV